VTRVEPGLANPSEKRDEPSKPHDDVEDRIPASVCGRMLCLELSAHHLRMNTLNPIRRRRRPRHIAATVSSPLATHQSAHLADGVSSPSRPVRLRASEHWISPR